MTTPVTTEPAPMPHPNDDPDFAAARQAQQNYPADVKSWRDHPNWSDTVKAQKITEVHTAYTAAVQSAAERLNGRRDARFAWLNAQLPTGPGIPADVPTFVANSLMATFRGHYDQAAKLDRDGRAKMLDDADRFGDEPARRAALTAILERTELQTVRDRPDRYSTLVAHVDEIIDLQNGGGSTYRSFTRQAFGLAKAPPEVARLPVLQAEEQAKLARWRAQGHHV